MRMATLELKIPPPVVAAAVAAAMWGISLVSSLLQVPAVTRVCAAFAVALIGGCFAVGGGISFRRAKTTSNPKKPEAASSLVISGIYTITRNPMYIGVAIILVAWAIALSSAWALLGPLAFVLYIGRFQIAPEERALALLFGAEYAAYKTRVRRWL